MNGSDGSCAHVPVRPLLSNQCSASAAAVGGEDEDANEEDEEHEEVGKRSVRIKRGPHEPTQKEILEHNATHVPFRSWCPHCVSAAAKASPHKKIAEEDQEKAIPCLHADYWFMRDDKAGESVPVIVVKDDETKAVGGHVVTIKGSVDWVAEKICEDIERFGHVGKIILKTDQENALKDLAGEVRRLRAAGGRETLAEESKVYDSQSNGVAERAVQAVEGIVRTHKLALENKLNRRIPSRHPIMTWLVEHAVDMMNKFQVGSDGRTPYERIRGKKYQGEVVEFGRRVFHMHPGKHAGGAMVERWGKGIFLGKLWNSDESIVHAEDGKIVKVRSIKLMVESESWSNEAIEKMNVARWKAQFAKVESRLEERDEEEVAEEVCPREVLPRDFSIRKDHLEKYGYSEDCGRCNVIRRGGQPKHQTRHSKQCRERIRQRLDEERPDLTARARERQEEYIASKVKVAVEKKTKADDGGNKESSCSVRGGEDEPPLVERASGSAGAVHYESQGQGNPDVNDNLPDVPESDFEELDEDVSEKPELISRKRPDVDVEDVEKPDSENEPPLKRSKNEKHKKEKEKKNKRDEKQKQADVSKRQRKSEFDENLNGLFQNECKDFDKSEAVKKIWEKDWCLKNPITKCPWNLEEPISQKKLFHLVHVHKPEFIKCEFVKKNSLKGTMINSLITRICDIQSKGGRKFAATLSVDAPRWACHEYEKLRKKGGVKNFGIHIEADEAATQMNAVRLATNSDVVADAIRKVQSERKLEDKMENVIMKSAEVESCAKLNGELLKIENVSSLHLEDFGGYYVDDTTGGVLNNEEVGKARKKEMQKFQEMGVYGYALKRDAILDKEAKLVGVRWVDVQKGEEARSRFVAQEFAGKDDREDIFAATPPLFATKLAISDAASRGDQGQGERALQVLDVKCAFLYGEIEDKVFIELPPEDPHHGQGYVGVLRKAMYGTRGAPYVWQKVVKRVMTNLGFERNLIHPCVYYHPKRDLLVVTHVDDFLCSGERTDLRWLRREIEREFEIKGEIIGRREGEKLSCEFLGRTIRVTPDGYEYEANPKHVKILMQEWGMENSRTLSSPGAASEKPNAHEKVEEEKYLDAKEAREYRRAAARINYLSLDRADISFSSKEVSRGMANPTIGDTVRLKRILRYLKGRPRVINRYKWQDPQTHIRGMCDSDWAGCCRTRKSTSGGVLMYGTHLLAHWSSTQSVIALSSAEAELNSMVKMASESLGVRNLLRCLHREKGIVIETDSTAASGIVHREGCGKVKHLETRQLWLQQHVQEKDVAVKKIPRARNCADCLTHHWGGEDGIRHLQRISISFVSV